MPFKLEKLHGLGFRYLPFQFEELDGALMLGFHRQTRRLHLVALGLELLLCRPLCLQFVLSRRQIDSQTQSASTDALLTREQQEARNAPHAHSALNCGA